MVKTTLQMIIKMLNDDGWFDTDGVNANRAMFSEFKSLVIDHVKYIVYELKIKNTVRLFIGCNHNSKAIILLKFYMVGLNKIPHETEGYVKALRNVAKHQRFIPFFS